VQEHPGAGRGEAPGRHHRLAPLAGTDALGDAVDEQIGDVVLAQVAGGELLVVGPEPLPELRDRCARQEQPPGLVAKGVLDVAHRQAAGQQFHRQILERLSAAFEMLADLGAPGFVTAGDLRRRVVHQTLRGPQPPRTHAVAVAAARLRAMLVVVSPERVPVLRLQRLLDDQPGRQPHQLGPPGRRRQAPFDQVGKRLAGAHRRRYSLRHGVPPCWRRRQPARVHSGLSEDAPLPHSPASLGLHRQPKIGVQNCCFCQKVSWDRPSCESPERTLIWPTGKMIVEGAKDAWVKSDRKSSSSC
jgi:hypothetical protein